MEKLSKQKALIILRLYRDNRFRNPVIIELKDRLLYYSVENLGKILFGCTHPKKRNKRRWGKIQLNCPFCKNAWFEPPQHYPRIKDVIEESYEIKFLKEVQKT